MGFMPDPDKILKDKGEDIKIYRDLMYDSHVDSCVTSRESGLLSNEWKIVPASTRGNNRKAADFISENLKSLDMERIQREIVEAVYFGTSFLEKIKIKDGKNIVYQDVVGKPQEWFRFNAENQPLFISKKNSLGELVDLSKIEIVQYRASYRNPYGERKLARLFWPVVFKKGGLKFWVQFAEKYGGVFMYAKTPLTDAKKREEILNMLDDMVHTAVGVFGTTDELQTLNFQKEGGKIYQDLVAVCNAEVSKSILGQTMTTETNGTGSYGAVKEYNSIRKDIIEHDKTLVVRHMNRLIKEIVDLNFVVSAYPEFRYFEEENIKLERSERDNKLTSLGVLFNKDYFVNNYNLNEKHFEVEEPQKKEPSLFPPEELEKAKKKRI